MLLILIKSLKLVSLRFGFVFCSFCMSCCNVMLRFFRKRSKFLFSFFHKEEFLSFFYRVSLCLDMTVTFTIFRPC